MNTRVHQLLAQTRGRSESIPPSSGVTEAIGRMRMARADLLAIIEDGRVCGVVSLKDLNRCNSCLSAHCGHPEQALVEQVMNKAVFTIAPEATVRASLRQLVSSGCEYSAVVGSRGFLGLLTLAELCASVAADLDQQVEELTQYICGIPSTSNQSKRGREETAAIRGRPTLET